MKMLSDGSKIRRKELTNGEHNDILLLYPQYIVNERSFV